MGTTRLVMAAGAVGMLTLAAEGASVGLLGSELSLRTHAQATPTSELIVTSFERTVTVSESEVEYPNVESLYNPDSPIPPGFAGGLVDVAIDVGADFIEIDFDNVRHNRFASGHENTYVFRFDDEVAVTIGGATIDESVTTLGLVASDLRFIGNELFVNVESLSFNTSTFARINLEVARGGDPTGPDTPGTVVPTPAAAPLALILATAALARRRR